MSKRNSARDKRQPGLPRKPRRRPSSSSSAHNGVGTKRAPGGDEPQAGAPPFLVAAIGASAGGLEAASALLRAIPPDAVLSLVLVQHLARDQRSLLPELLGNNTRLKVLAAVDQQTIVPGHVYVIPPDTRMTVTDGHLRVRPASAQREQEGTVDLLFRSVAAEYRDKAIGVVLSGSAHDGAAGIREIKAAGGIALVQEPGEAAVDGMPKAAIATGVADAVLPVEQIAQHLVQLARHPFFSGREASDESDRPSDSTDLSRVFQLLRRVAGVDFSAYKVATLKRRVERRMSLHRISDIKDYVKRLEADPGELERLQDELLIHVTSFFREPDSYQMLRETLLPRLFADKARDNPFRFWVPGCSTGEEVYSLAMVVMEFLSDAGAAVPLQIFGTDVSDITIDKARAGVYPADISADVSAARLRRFFTPFDGGYRINKEVRDHCVFARQDVTRDPPFSKLDVIICRNLLIYLNQATQRKVLGVFHYALRPDGVLMLGRSETIGSQAELFSVADKRFQLYAKKRTGGLKPGLDFPPVLPLHSLPPAIKVHARRSITAPGEWDAQGDANRFLLERYAPPAVIVDADNRVLRARGSTGRFLELPTGDVSVDVLKMARPEVLPALRALLHEARTRNRVAAKEGLRVRIDGRPHRVTMQVVPIGHADPRQYLILFEERRPGSARAASPKLAAAANRGRSSRLEVERELAETRQQLQAIIDDLAASNEELQSANEEILSSNEELQSTNEELDTAKEEMQSTNEELSTLNDELHGRNDELTTLNSDLLNLLASVQIPIVMVNRDLRIRRFTPAAEKVLNIIPSDVGRPIGHLKPNFLCPDLESMIAEVIDSVAIKERRVESSDGRAFVLQIRPYTSVDNHIDGAVVVMFDVSSAEDQAMALDVALEVAKAAGDTALARAREPVLLLDGELKVLRANRAFVEWFALGDRRVEGQFIYELADGQWNTGDLRRLLEQVLPEKTSVEGFPLARPAGAGDGKQLLVDARRIDIGRRKQGLIIMVVREGAAGDAA